MLWGGAGPDLLVGGPGDDRLYGSKRSVQLGESGDDYVQVTGGSVFMGHGSDVIDAHGGDLGMHVRAGHEDDRINVQAPYTADMQEPHPTFAFDCGEGYDSFHWYTSSNPGAPQAPYSWASTNHCEVIVVHDRLTP